jgi:hypothetical protein
MKNFVLGWWVCVFWSSVAFAGGSPFFPAHVQVCTANLSESGQGIAYEAWVQYTETEQGKGSCSVTYYYGYEYGCGGFRGMCQVYPQSVRGLKCQVQTIGGSERSVWVRDAEGHILVKGCRLEWEDSAR